LKWWRGALGLERDANRTESKAIIGVSDGLSDWAGGGQLASRQDGTNFRTNTVSLADYQDRGTTNDAAVLGLSTTWACVNLLAGLTGSLSFDVTQKRGNLREPRTDHPLQRILDDSPNADQTGLDFWEFISACLELKGNGYSEVERRNNGIIIAMDAPLPPDLVQPRRRSDGSIEYEVADGRSKRVIPQERMLHIRGFGGSPLGGLSTLAFGSAMFRSALSVERAASQTFRQGARSVGAFVSDKQLNAEQMQQADDRVTEKYQAAVAAGKPLILNNGFQWHSLSINPDDAQMLESRNFSVEEICRFFGVPPHMVGHTQNSTSWGTGLEQQTLGFLMFTLRRRLKRIEKSVAKQLLTPADRAAGISVRFNVEDLLRVDSQGRAKFYEVMTRIGAMTINEVRALENLPPVEGGDVPRMQMQNVPITDAGSGLAGDPSNAA
jgi:HK97 family phage portal protein